MSWISEWWHDAEDWVSDAWDWIGDVWGEFVNLFVWTMNNIFDKFGDWFIYGVALVIGGVILETWGVLTAIWSGLVTVGGWISSGWSWITGWGAALYKYWEEFMEWMRWDDIKRLSDIAEIVSPEWRAIVTDVYGQISDVSKQLGLGSGFMLLALSDARNLVLDASSLMGRSYDLGEVAWMSSLTGYLGEFSEKAQTFENNPEALILDIQNYFDKDIVDNRAGFQKTILDFMGTSISGLKETGIKLTKLKDTLEQTVLHLPEQISRPLYAHMKDEFEAFDSFMDDKFTPVIGDILAVTDILSELGTSHTKQLSNIQGLLSNPGEVLANINALPEIERLRQEGQITEISTRAFSTESEVRNKAIDDDNIELTRIADALRSERKPPEFLRLEYEGPKRAASIPNGVFVSWQVGDY